MAEDMKSGDWVQLSHIGSSKHSSDSTFQSDVADPPPWLMNLQDFADRSADNHLGSGDHLDHFVQYLKRPYDPRFCDARPSSNATQREFAVLYDFQSACVKQVLRSPVELNDLPAQNAQDLPQSQLLILRGHPSPEWVNAVANAFGVDAEFFYHHLELFSRKQGDPSWTRPPLASSSAREPRLRLTTLGTVNKPNQNAREEKHINRLRCHVRGVYKDYLEVTQQETRDVGVGTSLLRGVHVHSARYFSFDQDVSIWTKQSANGWCGVAWIDVGTDDLFHGPAGDSLRTPLGGKPENTIFGSTVFRRAAEVDSTQRTSASATRKDDLDTPDGITQNAKHLCHQYEEGLDLTLARADSFYAFSNLFAFSAASENQFLNMVQYVIRDDVHHATVLAKEKGADASLSNLVSNQLVLSEHVKRLEENILAIHKRDTWPKLSSLSPDVMAQANQAGIRMLDDYQGLLHRAKALGEECDRGIRRIEHLESYAESKKAIEQAEGVARLTRLGFVFVPMSFSCAFFGMNFKEIDKGSLSLWVWIAATVPIMILSFALMVTNFRHRLGSYLGFYRMQRRREDRDAERAEP